MVYGVKFFGKRSDVTASDALDQLAAAVAETGGPVLLQERGGGLGTSWCDLTGEKASGTHPLHVQVWTGVQELAEEILQLTPDGDTHGIWGSDLLVSVQLIGEVDWALMRRVWDVLVKQWGAVPHDDISEFEITF
ncbi:hypothetical protein [Actinomadura rugatobispora]|uniref:Uncharacterized protein n=1 Tax=Actinomadura rugatobispora TaxID=1994 RepID=A0ABW0ZRA7_9ACTN|nr:hypothetical protein GCM10010200_043290 [Actinomadura rugatobispora]